MSTKEAKQMDQALFDFYGKPSIGQALPLAIQHVLAMIVGCVTPSIIVAGVAGLSQEDSVILIQAALVMSALTTLLQLFPFIKTKSFRIGSALPVMMGISFAYVPSMQAIAADFDIATILGAQIVGGVIALLVGLNIKRIRKFFPPLITGTVVFSIGLSLYPTATYSQNVGIVSTTKVVSRVVMGMAAVILLAAGLIPKFSSLLTTIPYCVLGGATISVFASITMTGIKLITTEPMDFRNTTVVGLAVAVGMGVTQANASLAQFPEWVTTIFGKSPVVLATIVAIVLNLTLPRTQKKAEK